MFSFNLSHECTPAATANSPAILEVENCQNTKYFQYESSCYRLTNSVTQKLVSQENAFKKSKNLFFFFFF